MQLRQIGYMVVLIWGERSHAIACSPFFSITVSSRNAGPRGFLTPLSQSETMFFETFR